MRQDSLKQFTINTLRFTIAMTVVSYLCQIILLTINLKIGFINSGETSINGRWYIVLLLMVYIMSLFLGSIYFGNPKAFPTYSIFKWWGKFSLVLKWCSVLLFALAVYFPTLSTLFTIIIFSFALIIELSCTRYSKTINANLYDDIFLNLTEKLQCSDVDKRKRLIKKNAKLFNILILIVFPISILESNAPVVLIAFIIHLIIVGIYFYPTYSTYYGKRANRKFSINVVVSITIMLLAYLLYAGVIEIWFYPNIDIIEAIILYIFSMITHYSVARKLDISVRNKEKREQLLRIYKLEDEFAFQIPFYNR